MRGSPRTTGRWRRGRRARLPVTLPTGRKRARPSCGGCGTWPPRMNAQGILQEIDDVIADPRCGAHLPDSCITSGKRFARQGKGQAASVLQEAIRREVPRRRLRRRDVLQRGAGFLAAQHYAEARSVLLSAARALPRDRPFAPKARLCSTASASDEGPAPARGREWRRTREWSAGRVVAIFSSPPVRGIGPAGGDRLARAPK